MQKHKYYYYDHDRCNFVEYAPKTSRRWAKHLGQGALIIALAYITSLGIDRIGKTGEEIALIQENHILQDQYSQLQQQVDNLSAMVGRLEDEDESIYRKVLETDPISKDVRKAGVGGSDPFAHFDGLTPASSSLLRETSQKVEQLTNQVSLQNSSYRQLTALASQKEAWLEQLPAILPSDGPVVSGYGSRFHPILKITRMHYGIDVLVSTGTPVSTTADGVIKEKGNSASFGKYVKVRHPATGYTTLYAHLSKIPRTVRRGKKVSRGDVIGYSGSTGLSKSPHLHYEIHDAQNRPLNPIFFVAPSMTPTKYKALLAAANESTSSFD